MIETIERTRCAVNGAADLEHLYTFRDFPVFMGCVDGPAEEDMTADMVWGIGRSSGMVQLQKLLPLDVLYRDSHAAGSVGGLWAEHHRAFASFIMRYAPRSVFEIGGGHGILSRECRAIRSVDWTILEPNPPKEREPDGPRYIRGFFDENFVLDRPVDAVVHSHLFEHIYDPNVFVENLGRFLRGGGKMFFSVPNMSVMLERKYTNTVNFEHTILLADEYVAYLLAEHGFEILAKERFKDDHSVFYACAAGKPPRPAALPAGLYERNKGLFMDYVDFHLDLVRGLNGRMRATRRPVYLFGAHVFSQYLFAFGLETERIAAVLDNAETKQGKRLYGTDLSVLSPKILARCPDEPVVILRAGVYNEEIKRDILDNINPRTEFWT